MPSPVLLGAYLYLDEPEHIERIVHETSNELHRIDLGPISVNVPRGLWSAFLLRLRRQQICQPDCRRITAMLRVCEGIDTEDLESGPTMRELMAEGAVANG